VCAIAARDVERGEAVVEYEGELIAAEEARERENDTRKTSERVL